MTITSLEDDVYGTLAGDLDCEVGTVLAPGDRAAFAFIGEFTGNAGSSQTDTVTDRRRRRGQRADRQDDATVTLNDVASTITVDKSANPTSLPEPGGFFTFTVTVTNNSD